MQTMILALHIVACVILVVLVLLQSGKEGMGVIFGGGNSSVFGSSGAGSMLAKLTAFVAVIFIVTSLSYNYISSADLRKSNSQILDVQVEEAVSIETPAAASAPAEEVAK